MDTTTIVVIAIFACIVVAAFLVYRRRANVKIKTPVGSVSINASNASPATPPTPGVRIKGAESTQGGLMAQDQTGRGADVESVKTRDDILVSSTPPKQDPKA
jgi:hypothetical protein